MVYRCYNAKKLVRIVICDIVVIIAVTVITVLGKNSWLAVTVNPETDIPLPVIMYHSIIDGVAEEKYIVSPQTIENDLKYLKENGYTAVLSADLVEYIENDKPLPEKPVMITLDDGYYNNMEYLEPLLEKYDMKAVISVVGSFTDKFSRTAEHNPKYSHLTWEDLSELKKNRRIEIGNHTYDMHSLDGRRGCGKLASESVSQYQALLKEDIGGLQTALTEKTGITPILFAYPYGEISRESISVLKELGFKVTLNCYENPNYINKDPDCLFGLNRYNREGNISTEAFMKKALRT